MENIGEKNVIGAQKGPVCASMDSFATTMLNTGQENCGDCAGPC